MRTAVEAALSSWLGVLCRGAPLLLPLLLSGCVYDINPPPDGGAGGNGSQDSGVRQVGTAGAEERGGTSENGENTSNADVSIIDNSPVDASIFDSVSSHCAEAAAMGDEPVETTEDGGPQSVDGAEEGGDGEPSGSSLEGGTAEDGAPDSSGHAASDGNTEEDAVADARALEGSCEPDVTYRSLEDAGQQDLALPKTAVCVAVCGAIGGWGCSSLNNRVLRINGERAYSCGGALPQHLSDGCLYFFFGPDGGASTYHGTAYWW